MDLHIEAQLIATTINSFLQFYQNLNRAGWMLRLHQTGWEFVHASLDLPNEGVLFLPSPAAVEMNSHWYVRPSTPPPSSPEPEEMSENPNLHLLLRQPQPRLTDCSGCPICKDETLFPNVIWKCGHNICQNCTLRMEESDITVQCPLCRENSPYIVGRVN